MAYLTVDMGGSFTKAAVWDKGQLLQVGQLPTPRGGEAIISSLNELTKGLQGQFELEAWSLCTTGVVREGILDSANLHLSGFALRKEIEKQVRLPLEVLVNDMAAVAAGEASAQNPSLAIIFLGTGVGSRLVEAGMPIEGAGAAGEIGHWSMDPEGKVCVCGRRGCIETALGWWSIRNQWQAKGRSADGGPETIASASQDGDLLAERLMQEAGQALGMAISLLVSSADPPLIRLGGGISEAMGDLLLPHALREVEARCWGGSPLIIERSPWMRLAPLRGLARMAKQPVPDSPDQL